MLQQTLAEVTFEQYRKPTRRERFLDEMNRVVPWTDLVAAIEPLCNSVGFYFHEKVWQRFERRGTQQASIPEHAWLHHQA